MAVTGLVLRQNRPEFSIVSEYYAAAAKEPTRKGLLPIDRTDTFNNTFKSLAETLLAKKRSHVVVVAHGTPEIGLIMPISHETKVSAGYCLPNLVKVVDQLDDTDGKSASDSFVKGLSNDWAVPQSTVLSLAKTCRKIRWSDGMCVAVHIRGCNIGKDLAHLRAVQRLFRSVVVSAPDCSMFYVRVKPKATDPDAYAKAKGPVGRRFVYSRPHLSKLVLDIDYAAGSASSLSVVGKSADVKGWAKVMHDVSSSNAVSSFVVAGFWPEDSKVYFLAHEAAYPDRLKTVKAV